MNRHAYYLSLARSVAQRSTCQRAQVGALLVAQDRILSTGFNGAPRHLAHCTQDNCLVHDGHCIRCVHAETNALLFAGPHTGDAFLYCTHAPCVHCCQHLINFGISMVYYEKAYNDIRISLLGFPTQQAYLEAAGVNCVRVDNEEKL